MLSCNAKLHVTQVYIKWAGTCKNPWYGDDEIMFLYGNSLLYLKDLQLLQSDLLTLTVFSGQVDGLQHEA